MKEKKFSYETSCLESTGHFINSMKENQTPITFETMKRNCEGLLEWSRSKGYDRELPIQNDFHVSYHKSYYRYKPCYYVRWSAIEFIWVKK